MYKKDRYISKVVAIAKDEAPYIADWVFHHLRFGFEKIHVYVNRTSDKTRNILDKINDKYPYVTYEFIDWVDLVPDNQVTKSIQKIAYAHSFYMSKRDCDYILYVDVDEYWTPLDFKSTINDCIEELSCPDVISFEWENLQGEDKAFSTIPRKLYVKGNGHVKSLVSSKAGLKKIRIHAPLLEGGNVHLLADGTCFKEARKISPQVIDRKDTKSKKYFILHRMFRSEVEYMATLNRGLPDSEGIKTNRPGFFKQNYRNEVICFPGDEYESYQCERSFFYDRCGIECLVKESQKNFVSKANEFISLLPIYCIRDFDAVKKIIWGVENKEVVKIVSDMDAFLKNIDEVIKGNESNADFLRDIAFSYERNGEFLAAYYLMLKAYALRPKGKVIKRSLLGYERYLIGYYKGM